MSKLYTMKPCPECGKPKKTRHDKEPARCKGKCLGAFISRRAKRTGYCPQRTMTDESEKRRKASLRSDEHKKRASVTLSRLKKEHPKLKKHSPVCGNSLHVWLKSPNNVTYKVDNLNLFVTLNPELFDPEDTVIRPYGKSRAYNGLLSITRKVTPRETWKGWTLASVNEAVTTRGENFRDQVSD